VLSNTHVHSHFLDFFREPHLNLARLHTDPAFFLFCMDLWFIQTGYCPCSSRNVRRLYFRDCRSSVSINDSPTTTLFDNVSSCRRAAATICHPPLSFPRGRRNALRRRADGNVAAVSHGQHVLTPTAAAAWRANTAVSKAAWWPWPLTLKVVSESRVTWATSVPILVFLGLSVLDLGPMYATDRQASDRCQRASSLYAPAYWGGASNSTHPLHISLPPK